MELTAISIFKVVIVTILICLTALYLIKRYYIYLKGLELKGKIYEIVTLIPQKEGEVIRVTSYYMLYEPGKNIDEIKEQIDIFISDYHVLKYLNKKYVPKHKLENIWFNIIFIRPTNDWPIGKLSDNREHFKVNKEMILASVEIRNKQYILKTFEDFP